MNEKERYLLLEGEARVPAIMVLGLPVEATVGRLLYSDRVTFDVYLLPPEGKRAEELTARELEDYTVQVYPGMVRKTYDRATTAQEVEHYFG